MWQRDPEDGLAKVLEDEVAIGLEGDFATRCQDEKVVEGVDVVSERQGIGTPHALEYCTTGSDLGQVASWDDHADYLKDYLI